MRTAARGRHALADLAREPARLAARQIALAEEAAAPEQQRMRRIHHPHGAARGVEHALDVRGTRLCAL
jgi:hypothetical protein